MQHVQLHVWTDLVQPGNPTQATHMHHSTHFASAPTKLTDPPTHPPTHQQQRDFGRSPPPPPRCLPPPKTKAHLQWLLHTAGCVGARKQGSLRQATRLHQQRHTAVNLLVKQTGKKTDRQTDGQTDSQTDREAGSHTRHSQARRVKTFNTTHTELHPPPPAPVPAGRGTGRPRCACRQPAPPLPAW